MLLALLACTTSPPPPEAQELPGAPKGPPDMPDVLVLPDTLPFTARTRVTPATLVDQHGSPLLVLEALGVEVVVERTLADRAYVRCTGCRAELDGWLQKRILLPVEGDAATDHDRLILGAAVAAAEATRHGLVEVEGVWTSPPWHDEGGYDGAVARLVDEAWTVTAPEPVEAPAEETSE